MANWLLLLLLFSICIANEFGTFYLTEEEWIDLDLHDYFTSNEISFYISNTNSTGNDISLSQNSSIQLTFHVQNEISDEFKINSNNNDEVFPIFSLPNNFLLIWYKGKEIILYLLSESWDMIKILWRLEISEKDCEGEITQIKQIPTGNIGYIIILLRCQQNKAWNIWKYEVYIMNLSNYLEPASPIKFNLWDVKYLSEAKISSQISLNHIAIFGRFYSKKQVIFIYEIDFQPQIHLKLIQSINHYNNFGENQENELNVVQILFLSYHMLLLDSKKGIFTYNFQKYKNFENKEYIDLSKYGISYSWSLQFGNYKNKLAVGTDKGIVILDSGVKNFEITHWIDIFDTTGYQLPVKSIYLENKFLILKLINNLMLFFVFKSKYYKYQFISIIDISFLVGINFNPAGLWIWIKDDSGEMYYLRDDYDGIRLYALHPRDWSLRIWGTHSFYAEIAGKTDHKNQKNTKQSLNVISIPLDSNEILKLENYQKLNSDIRMDNLLEQFIHGKYIYPNTYFSGPNLTFSIDYIDFPKNVSVEVSEFYNTQISSYVDINKPLYILKQCNQNIGIVTEEGFLFLNNIDGKYKSFKISPFIIDFSWGWSSSSFIILEYANNTQWLSIYKVIGDENTPLQFINKIEFEHECIFFKRILDDYSSVAIICASNELISIYFIYNDGYIIIEFQKLQLNTYGIHAIMDMDATLLKSYMPNDNKLFLYIIDMHEGLVSIECLQNIFPCKIYKSLQIARSNIQKFHATSDFVYLIYLDGKIRVFDIYLQFIKSMSPRTKGRLINSYALFNILVMQIDSHVFIFDAQLSSHNSLYRAFDIYEHCQLIISEEHDTAAYFVPLITFRCKDNESSSRLLFYKFLCKGDVGMYMCPYFFSLDISLKNDTIVEENEFSGKITLIAKNLYDKSIIDINYKIRLTDNSIRVNYETIPKEIEIEQNKLSYQSKRCIWWIWY